MTNGLSYGYKNDHGTFDIVLMDPPWPYKARLRGEGRTKFGEGATGHYDTMTDEDLFCMGTELKLVLADRAAIFMWTTGPRLPLAFDLGRFWGLDYATVAFSWFKTTKDGEKFRELPGCYTASNVELCLLFTHSARKGATKLTPENSGGVRMLSQVVWEEEEDAVGAVPEWPTGTVGVRTPLGKHSSKPEIVQTCIELMYPGLRSMEMFARRERDGWATLGNELDGLDIRDALTLAAGGYYDIEKKEVLVG